MNKIRRKKNFIFSALEQEEQAHRKELFAWIYERNQANGFVHSLRHAIKVFNQTIEQWKQKHRFGQYQRKVQIKFALCNFPFFFCFENLARKFNERTNEKTRSNAAKKDERK